MAEVAAPPNGIAEKSQKTDTTESTLQLRYMELLEKRIAQLEQVVESTSKQLAEAKTSDSTTSDSKTASTETKSDEKSGDAATQKEAGKEGATEIKTSSRYKNIKRQWNSKTEAYEDTELDAKSSKTEDDTEVAFVFRRVYRQTHSTKKEDDDTAAYSEIDVEAQGLRNLLKELIGDYPGQNLEGNTVYMITPFQAIIHSWDELIEESEKTPENPKTLQAHQDLAKLLDTIKTSPELDKYFKSRESNRSANMITYETLWTLWKPKTLIWGKPFLGEDQCFELYDCELYDRPETERRQYFWAWNWEWNGKTYVKALHLFWIEKFKGTKEINLLDYYPIRYHKAGDEFKERMRVRGEKYDKIVTSKVGASQMWSYDGKAIFDQDAMIKLQSDTNRDQDDDRSNIRRQEPGRQQRSIRGNIIVDSESFIQFGQSLYPLGDKEPYSIIEDDKVPEEPKQKEEPGKDQMLRPPRLLGYATKEKRWGQYSIDGTSEAQPKDPKAFEESLELDPKYKAMIKALVEEHAGDRKNPRRKQVVDLVADKGKGLVLLLHGPPGVGKTLTAETIARATGKPLFVVSVAEIGLNASRAERNLEQLFFLAGRWESVLLVDEADVFLESRRESADPNRNALVSVLLRVLEYYNGIMILTTNRINSLDIAVQSRIHLAIRYDDLSRDQKKKIFRTFLDHLEPECIKDYDEIIEFIDRYGCKDKLNGREIRNVVSSALSLARSEAEEKGGDGKMTKDHLADVMEITKDFQDQLEDITKTARLENEALKARR